MASHYVAKKDAEVVAMIKNEGAIPIVRGNVP
jgi:Asp-tRNA(Asn)/Glu-tRNA(Gln) amidotransferase A subunit family amidase